MNCKSCSCGLLRSCTNFVRALRYPLSERIISAANSYVGAKRSGREVTEIYCVSALCESDDF